MLNPRYCRLILLLLSALACSNPARAQSQDFGDYTVYYIAVNSTFLDPVIARQYDIIRSDRRAFLNISVLKNNTDGSSTAVTAIISGKKVNLLQQSQTVEFREIREENAIYYLGEFEFSNAENLRFELDIQPEQTGAHYPLEWTTQMFNNR